MTSLVLPLKGDSFIVLAGFLREEPGFRPRLSTWTCAVNLKCIAKPCHSLHVCSQCAKAGRVLSAALVSLVLVFACCRSRPVVVVRLVVVVVVRGFSCFRFWARPGYGISPTGQRCWHPHGLICLEKGWPPTAESTRYSWGGNRKECSN